MRTKGNEMSKLRKVLAIASITALTIGTAACGGDEQERHHR